MLFSKNKVSMKKFYYFLPFVVVPGVVFLCELFDALSFGAAVPYIFGVGLVIVSAVFGLFSPSKRLFDYAMAVIMPISLFWVMFLVGFLDQDDLGTRFHFGKAFDVSLQPMALILYALMALVTCLASLRAVRRRFQTKKADYCK